MATSHKVRRRLAVWMLTLYAMATVLEVNSTIRGYHNIEGIRVSDHRHVLSITSFMKAPLMSAIVTLINSDRMALY